jgi:hypothetical protein
MPQSNLVRAFLALWWTLGAVLLYLSIQTVIHAHEAPGSDVHVALLGAVEAIAAILFLIPRTMRTGGLALLATFAAALLFHAAHGQLGTPLLIYAAGMLFVMVHGPVPLHAHGRDAR